MARYGRRGGGGLVVPLILIILLLVALYVPLMPLLYVSVSYNGQQTSPYTCWTNNTWNVSLVNKSVSFLQYLNLTSNHQQNISEGNNSAILLVGNKQNKIIFSSEYYLGFRSYILNTYQTPSSVGGINLNITEVHVAEPYIGCYSYDKIIELPR